MTTSTNVGNKPKSSVLQQSSNVMIIEYSTRSVKRQKLPSSLKINTPSNTLQMIESVNLTKKEKKTTTMTQTTQDDTHLLPVTEE